MVVMTGAPGDLGQTIALRPDAQTQTDDNNAMMRLSRNKTVGHGTAPQKAAIPQARNPASAGELSHEAGPLAP